MINLIGYYICYFAMILIATFMLDGLIKDVAYILISILGISQMILGIRDLRRLLKND